MDEKLNNKTGDDKDPMSLRFWGFVEKHQTKIVVTECAILAAVFGAKPAKQALRNYRLLQHNAAAAHELSLLMLQRLEDLEEILTPAREVAKP